MHDDHPQSPLSPKPSDEEDVMDPGGKEARAAAASGSPLPPDPRGDEDVLRPRPTAASAGPATHDEAAGAEPCEGPDDPQPQ